MPKPVAGALALVARAATVAWTNWLMRSGLKTGDEIAVRGTAALKGAWQGLGPAVDSKEP